MQLTNGAIKTGSKNPTIPLSPKGHIMVKDRDVDLETFDLSDFVFGGKGKKEGEIRPSTKNTKQLEVDKFLAEGAELFKLGEKYEKEVVARGHQALYELLASIYGLALRIENSDQVDKINEAIRKNLKDAHDIKVQKNSSPMATLVRYVIRADKLAASRYGKVLQVARDEDLSAEELPAYITRRGGIAQIQDTESKQLAKTTGEGVSKERLALIREYFELVGIASKEEFTYGGDLIVHNEEKDTKAENSSFCVFIAHYEGGEKYKMVSANDLGKTFENTLIKFIGKNLPSDLHVLERGIRNFKKQLLSDSSLPKGFHEKLNKQLALPMKHKQADVVIDVDASTPQITGDDPKA
jgi:hypothetical protein